MSLLHDAYTALLSGLTTKTGNEIHWENEVGQAVTIEPIDIKKQIYIIRRYYPNGNKIWEAYYQNEEFHGKSIGWHENGNKRYEVEFQNGQSHGKYINWDESGNKIWEALYQNGVRIK